MKFVTAPIFAVLIALGSSQMDAHALSPAQLTLYQQRIENNFSNQLTNPQKKNRKSKAQFGYGLSYFKFNVYPITEFINPHHFGVQSYSKPARGEHYGSLYTCRGGFMDFSHIRAGLDWSVFMTFTLLTSNGDSISLPPEAGSLEITTQDLQSLSLDEISDIGQKISFERLIWHETASWHYHAPNHRSEQQSAFSIEDSYSNLLGTLIGKKVALRLLDPNEKKSYEEVATEEIAKMIESLEPMSEVAQSKMAYDLVDRHQQLKLPEAERNADVWWDSKVVFQDQRYLFKRVLPLSSEVVPWLVPHQEKLGCSTSSIPQVLQIPKSTAEKKSLYDHYTFKIIPDEKELFYNHRNGKLMHAPFGAFTTEHLNEVIRHVSIQMEAVLGSGFSERDSHDPIPGYNHVNWMWFHKNSR